jgi:hypothetical protein
LPEAAPLAGMDAVVAALSVAEPEVRATDSVVVDLAARLGLMAANQDAKIAAPEAVVSPKIEDMERVAVLTDTWTEAAVIEDAEIVRDGPEDDFVLARVLKGRMRESGTGEEIAAAVAQPEPVAVGAEPVVAEPVAEMPSAEEAVTAPEVSATEADMFDEDALREIVRDVLREELQGEFGERITRNVRKMVRAELAKALLAQSSK